MVSVKELNVVPVVKAYNDWKTGAPSDLVNILDSIDGEQCYLAIGSVAAFSIHKFSIGLPQTNPNFIDYATAYGVVLEGYHLQEDSYSTVLQALFLDKQRCEALLKSFVSLMNIETYTISNYTDVAHDLGKAESIAIVESELAKLKANAVAEEQGTLDPTWL